MRVLITIEHCFECKIEKRVTLNATFKNV